MTAHIFCSRGIDAEIEQNLSKLGAVPVKLCGLEKYGNHPLGCHPDMLCFNLCENKWIFYKTAYMANKDAIDGLNLEIVIEKDPSSCRYPEDVGLCAAAVGDNLICSAKYTNEKILKSKKNIIDVRQGYAKCSVCVVDENAIITSDAGICKKALQSGIDALLIEPGHIGLDGYGYGFIGGCSGLICKNTLAFTGNIGLHPNYWDIKKFCENRGVGIISLSEKRLYDYGSLLKQARP